VTTTRVDPPDDELDRLLRDLGAHLDLGPGEGDEGRADLVAAVLAGIAADPDAGVEEGAGAQVVAGADPVARIGDHGHRRGRRPGDDRRRRVSSRVLVAAAVVVVALAVLLASTPGREAVADWFGIGSVRITRSDGPSPTGDPTGPATAPRPTVDVDDLPELVPFEVRLPDPARSGEPVAAFVDTDMPPGRVEVRYPTFTLIEVGAPPNGLPSMTKSFASRGTSVTSVTVGGNEGLWLSGDAHEVAEVGPDGEEVDETRRQAGNVLLWVDDGVTYRIEGLDSLDDALAIAASIE
jgi:hypothetical protein